MLLARLVGPSRHLVGGGLQKRQRIRERVQRLHQVAVVGRPIERLMELPIDAGTALDVVDRRRVLIQELEEHRDLGLAGVLGRQRRGGPFQRAAGGIQLRHLGAVELGDHGAAPRRQLQQSVRLQAPERFPHRRAADPEPAGDLGFADALAGLVAAAADGVLQPPEHELAERGVEGPAFDGGVVGVSGHGDPGAVSERRRLA